MKSVIKFLLWFGLVLLGLYVLGFVKAAYLWFMGLPFVAPVVFMVSILGLTWFILKLWERQDD